MGEESRNTSHGDVQGNLVQTGEIRGDLNFHAASPSPQPEPEPALWYRILAIVFVVEVALGGPGAGPIPLMSQSQQSPPARSQVIESPAPSSLPSQPRTTQQLAPWSQKPQPQPARPRSPQLQVAKEKLVNACANRQADDQRTREGGPVAYTPGLVYEIVVQNPSDTEIVLTGLRADVSRRQMSSAGELAPAPGGCRFWTDMPVRELVFNLDTERPRAVSAERVETDGNVSMQLPTTGVPRKSFPYKVLKGESEVFHVGFETSRCDCEFTLVVEAAAGGESIEASLSTVHRVVPKNQ
ncbi:hypothetical protein ACSHWB_30195 [Lentzea sp. HUAS TT2]|uniref:hypothetical protein n=1 Tax=Lentzea sp. HUAS TT2 TaxID=3447454 RepID=UPI003F7227AF